MLTRNTWLRQEVEGAQHALNIKVAELKRIKRLARNVLRQRSEVEQFLVDSISHVKAQIQRSREAFLKVPASMVRCVFLNAHLLQATKGTELPPLNRTRLAMLHTVVWHAQAYYCGMQGAPGPV